MANPNFKKKTPAEFLKEGGRDFRVRNASPDVFKELDAIGQQIRRRTVPDIILFLINNFRSDKKLYAQAMLRNGQLHKSLSRYVDREAAMIKVIQEFIRYTEEYNKMTVSRTKKILADFKKKGGRP